MKKYEKEIINLLQSQSGSSKAITPETRIHHDLFLWGDDVGEVLGVLEKEHKIDFSKFEFEKFFLIEGMTLGVQSLLIKRMFGSKKVPEKIPVTVGHLAEVVKQKKWFDPPLSPTSYP